VTGTKNVYLKGPYVPTVPLLCGT